MISQLVSEIFIFESVIGRTQGRTDADSSPILLAHPEPFGSGELKTGAARWPHIGPWRHYNIKLTSPCRISANSGFSGSLFMFFFNVNAIITGITPIEPMLNKRDISNNIVTVLKARGKHAPANVNFTANDVSPRVRRCNVALTVERCYKICRHSQTIDGISSVQWRKVGRS